MSTIEEAIVKVLSDSTTVGAQAGDRIYPSVIPQGGTVPAVTYQLISDPHIRALDGVDVLVPARFQINCWAATYIAACNLDTVVREVLDDFSGTILGVVIHIINLDDSDDLFEPAASQNNRRRFGRRLDFIIWHEE